mmetsp:Transcript_65427/g.156442  ORF Transcript_65427/g.156442 Transcript_65427/m.156442 type:complete len:1252 (+) Transcript_65427:325-4080(+)
MQLEAVYGAPGRHLTPKEKRQAQHHGTQKTQPKDKQRQQKASKTLMMDKAKPMEFSLQDRWPTLTKSFSKREQLRRLDALTRKAPNQTSKDSLGPDTSFPWSWQPSKLGCKQLVRARGPQLEWNTPPMSRDGSREALPTASDDEEQSAKKHPADGSMQFSAASTFSSLAVWLPKLPQQRLAEHVYNRRRAGPAVSLQDISLATPITPSMPSKSPQRPVMKVAQDGQPDMPAESIPAPGDEEGSSSDNAQRLQPFPPSKPKQRMSKGSRAAKFAATNNTATAEQTKMATTTGGLARTNKGSHSCISFSDVDKNRNTAGSAWKSAARSEEHASNEMDGTGAGMRRSRSQPAFGSDGQRAGDFSQPTLSQLRKRECDKQATDAVIAGNKPTEEISVAFGDTVLAVRTTAKRGTVVIVPEATSCAEEENGSPSASDNDGPSNKRHLLHAPAVQIGRLVQERVSLKEQSARFGPSGARRSMQARSVTSERNDYLHELQQQLRAGLACCESMEDCTSKAASIIELFKASTSEVGAGKLGGASTKKGSDSKIQELRQREVRRRGKELQSEAKESVLMLGAANRVRKASIEVAAEDYDRDLFSPAGERRESALRKASLGMLDAKDNYFDEEDSWIEVFHKFKEDNQVHRDDMPKMVERLGLVPDKGWAEEVFGTVTKYTTIRLDEWIFFVRCYMKKQQQAFEQAFEDADADKSGFIDSEELAQLLRNFNIEPLKHVLAEVVEEVAEDSRGQINYRGFEIVMKLLRTREGFATQQFNNFMDVFLRFDRDASGEIDARELNAILNWLGYTFDESKTKGIIAEVDKDDSGKINQREFLACMRLVHDAEIRRVRKIMEDHDEDGSGELDTAELKALFHDLGYLPDDEAVFEAVRDAGLDEGDTSYDLSELIRVLMVYRSREGLSGSETSEIEEHFGEFEDGRSGEMNAIDIGKLLLQLGHSTAVHASRSAIAKVDPDCGKRLDLIEVKKLARMFREKDLQPIQENYLKYDPTGKGHVGPKEALLILVQAGCVNADGDIPRDVANSVEALTQLDLQAMLNVAMQYFRARRKAMRDHFGYTWAEVAQLKEMFRKYDEDNSGDIANRELMHLIEDAIPEMAHDRALRPKLLDVLRMVDRQGSGSVVFHEFLHLMRLLQEISDREKVTKEIAAVTDTGFSPQEVEEFRTLFLSHNEGIGALTVDHARAIIHMITPVGDKYAEEFRSIFYEMVTNEKCVADFPDFLRLVKRLLDMNFANLHSALNKAE